MNWTWNWERRSPEYEKRIIELQREVLELRSDNTEYQQENDGLHEQMGAMRKAAAQSAEEVHKLKERIRKLESPTLQDFLITYIDVFRRSRDLTEIRIDRVNARKLYASDLKQVAVEPDAPQNIVPGLIGGFCGIPLMEVEDGTQLAFIGKGE